MCNRYIYQAFLLAIILILPFGRISADERNLPSVEINGIFFPFSDAVALRGGKLEKKEDNRYLVIKGKEYFEFKSDGTGLSAVSAALWPDNILVNFTFKDTLGSARTYINGRGPVLSIKIDNKGNGQGTAYIPSSRKSQNIELRNEFETIRGPFSVKNKNYIICIGHKKFHCK